MAGKTTFKYDKNGNLIAYRDGKRIGQVGGMGDSAKKKKTSRKTTARGK